jgi:putative ABC transport system ATP-binding protein
MIMALQHPPKILLLDEHTSALDPNTAKRIMSLTHHMVKEHNITCLMITHNLQDAIKYGNRILILHKGRIEKEYSKAEKSTLTHHDLIDVMLSIGG